MRVQFPPARRTYKDAEGTLLESFQYTYDATGNPISRAAAGGKTQSYEYDELGRLTRVDYSDRASDIYTYNATGDRTSKNGEAYTYNALGEMLTAPGGATYTYDAQGRQVSETASGSTKTFAYDSLDRLKQITSSGAGAAALSYDAQGRLVSTTGAGITRSYAYDADDMAFAESTVADSPLPPATKSKHYAYGPSGVISQRAGSDTPLGLMTDEHGSVAGLVSETGAVTERRSYDPFGVSLDAAPGPSGIDSQSLGYVGAYARPALVDSELVVMGARVYDPASGRFGARDPLPGTAGEPQRQNAYAYGLNAPGTYFDLDGESASFAAPWQEIGGFADDVAKRAPRILPRLIPVLTGPPGWVITCLVSCWELGHLAGEKTACAIYQCDYPDEFTTHQRSPRSTGAAAPSVGPGAAGTGGAWSMSEGAKPNFDDPNQSPGNGWVRSPEGKGWIKPETGESLRPDLDHGPPHGPHYDYNRRPGKGGPRARERWFPDGSRVPK